MELIFKCDNCKKQVEDKDYFVCVNCFLKINKCDDCYINHFARITKNENGDFIFPICNRCFYPGCIDKLIDRHFKDISK